MVVAWDTADAASHEIMRLGLHVGVIYETQQPLGVFQQTEENDNVEPYREVQPLQIREITVSTYQMCN